MKTDDGHEKRPRFWLWFLLLVPLALGISRLRFEVEILNLLPAKLGVVQGLKLYQQHFANARELILTVEAPTVEEAESASRALAETLRARTNLVASVMWQPVWMEDPGQAAELMAFLWLNQPPAVFAEMAHRLAPGNLGATLQATRERLATSLSLYDLATGAHDPYGLMRLPEVLSSTTPAMGTGEGVFASPDGTFHLVFVEAGSDLSGYRACRSWMDEVRRVLAEARQSGAVPANVALHTTGRPAFVDEISRSMEQDMGGASAGTLAVIGLLFWLTHRRLVPLFWLVVMLLAILGGSLALGGLFFGTINVVSMGFASILLGLSEDFGIVIYQGSRTRPDRTARELRREAAPGIGWSALTTAGAFLMLNLSALPGLGQLGSLVAIGIVLASVVMLYGYTPLVLRFRPPADCDPRTATQRERFLLFQANRLLPKPMIWLITVAALVAAGVLIGRDGLRTDHSPDPLKPKRSEAYATMDRIKANLTRAEEPLWVLVPGRSEGEVAGRLAQAEAVLDRAVSNQWIAGYTLPTLLWPQPEHQRANRRLLASLLPQRESLRQAASRAGFTPDALFMTEQMLDVWQGAATEGNAAVFWPTNRASRWILARLAARTDDGFLAVGWVQPTRRAAATRQLAAEWPAGMQEQGVILSGWELLGSTVFDLVLSDLPRVMIPVFLLVVATLWLAFRRVREVVLSLATLVFSAVCLTGTMNLLGWEWNLLNVMGLPLLLGMGVDFSIHIQLALRDHGGDLLALRQSVGRALLLAGSTTVAGFASLAFSSNAGMASLGLVCALGITLTLLVAVYLLPVWWKAWK